MMVAVVRNFLLLLVIFLTTGLKGLLNAEICSKSAETVRPVQKCPANETEWDKAARRKNCSKIQKDDNCKKVEYHCLVNEFKNETIEVCTKKRIIRKGHCPVYLENEATSDWLNICANQTSCNCSRDAYNSTEAYKWQCCYNGANILPNKNRRGDSVKDQSNNEHLEIWLPVLVLFIVAAAGYVGCVYYGKKRDQNKTFFEALKIWKNVPCTNVLNKPSEDVLKPLTEPPNKDSLNKGMSALDSLQPSVSPSQIPRGEISDLESAAGNAIVQQSDESGLTNPETPKTPTLCKRKQRVEILKNYLELKMLRYFGGGGIILEYKLKSIKQKIINRKSCGNLLLSNFKMDTIEDKFKSLEEKAKTLEEILKEMNESADANIESWFSVKLEGPVASFIDDSLIQDDNTKRMEDHIRMPCSQPAILPIQSKKICSDGKEAQENILISDKVDTLKTSFETWWAGLNLPAFRRLEQDLLDIEVDTIIINYLFAFGISVLNDKIENSHQKALSKQDIQEALEEINVTFDELKEENEVF